MMACKMAVLMVVVIIALSISCLEAKKVHYIHWNHNNPLFRIDNTDHIVDVNKGNLPWEYDQVNLICPVSKPGSRYPEQHVIYSVSRDEFDSCRITNPKPRIVAVCNRPHRLMYFTITFRSFTPTPGGLEFKPGEDYYFISTSSREDLHRRVGGGCTSHNMKMIFKVHDNRLNLQEQNDVDFEISEEEEEEEEEFGMMTTTSTTSRPSTTTSTTMRSSSERGSGLFRKRFPKHDGEYIYYYHPRDLVSLEENLKVETREDELNENSLYNHGALRYTSSSSSLSISKCLLLNTLIFTSLLFKTIVASFNS